MLAQPWLEVKGMKSVHSGWQITDARSPHQVSPAWALPFPAPSL